MTGHQFILKTDLSEVVGGQKVIASSIGPLGEACLLLVPPGVEKDPFGREERKGGGALFPLSRSPKTYAATFIRFDGRLIQRTELCELNIAFPTVQPLPNGEVLLVGARCHYRNGDPEQNALICGPEGEVIRRFVLGDGINDVQTTGDGMIWVSYFDEGVFGNYGWDKPVGSCGLVCFDPEGSKIWEFEPPDGFDSIADCYALNVSDDAVWACYYTDFPVLRVDSERKTQAWKNSYGGANALAVDGRRVALWGGFRDRHSRCILQQIHGDTLDDAVELAIGFPEGIDSKSVRVRGRGTTLHGFVGNSWLSYDLGGFP